MSIGIGMSVSALTSKGDISVWLIAGQSNAEGFGLINDTSYSYYDGETTVSTNGTNDKKAILAACPELETGVENVLYWGNVANSSLDSVAFTPVKLGQGESTNEVGAEIGIAAKLANDGGMHAVIKCAVGATYLYPNTYSDASNQVNIKWGTWTPPSYMDSDYRTNNDNFISTGNSNSEKTLDAAYHGNAASTNQEYTIIGNMYEIWVEDTLKPAIAALKADGYNPVIKGIWWMQGEAETFMNWDCSTAASTAEGEALATATYKELLKFLISEIRSDLTAIVESDCSEVPFIMGRIYRRADLESSNPAHYLKAINQAQDEIAADDSLTNVGIVNADDWSESRPTPQRDGWHYTASVQKWLGTEFVSASEAEMTGTAYTPVAASEEEQEAVAPKATDSGGIVTEYGTIPEAYSDATAYPIIIFDKNGNFINTNPQTFNAALDYVTPDAKSGVGNNYTILLRDNVSATAQCNNLGFIENDLTIDLGGFTVTREAGYLFAFSLKADKWGNNPGYLHVKNGTFNVAKGGALIAFEANNNYTGSSTAKIFNTDFTNVSFVNNGTTGAGNILYFTNGTPKPSTLNLDFYDCSFELPNKSGGYNFIGTLNTSGGAGANINIHGGEIVANVNPNFNTFISSGPNVTFKNGSDGRLPLYIIPNDAANGAPTGTFKTSVGDATFTLQKDNESGKDIYRLTPTAVSDFHVKTNITLYSDLIFNAYLYPSALIDEITIGSDTYTKENISNLPTKNIDGTEYYVLSVNIAAKEALADISLKVKFTLDDLSTISASYTLGLVKYVNSALGVIAADSTAAAEAERAVLYDMLSYIRAAYSYWTVSDSDISEIDALLGEGYDAANAPEFNMEAATPTLGNGTLSATITLTATPAFKLYVDTNDASVDINSFVFTVDGVARSYTTGSDGNGTYCLISLYAYEMTKTLSYTVSGTNYSGSYNILAYYNNAAMTESEGSPLLTLVERFMKYCESAEAFKSVSSN